MSSRGGDSWSEVTQPIVEQEKTPVEPDVLCFVLAFDRMHPTTAPMSFAVNANQIVVGRGAATALDGDAQRISIRDRSISMEHFVVTREHGRWVLDDHGSKNGTFVNGVRVARHALRDGDVIEAGANYVVVTRAPARAAGLVRRLGSQTSTGLDSLSPALADQFAHVDRLARSDLPIHISGETGAGKEVVAREVHRRSGRPGKFVAVNCGAIPDALIASELFGAKRGAYSGAASDRDGLIKTSDRGTLFLDEIAELPLPSQAALLRVLQEREVVPVGGTSPEPCDLRVISATNKDLKACCDDGSFRYDLYARLYGANVALPPLRQRRTDLGLLIGRLLSSFADGRDYVFSRSAAHALFAYDWPCNVRELRRALAIAIATFDPGLHDVHITEQQLPLALQVQVAETAKSDSRRFRDLVSEYAGNVTALSQVLGTSRSHVRRLALRYSCDLGAFRKSS